MMVKKKKKTTKYPVLRNTNKSQLFRKKKQNVLVSNINHEEREP